MLRPFLSVVLAVLCLSCARKDAIDSAQDYVILAPDWRNQVVHRISMEGTYEGDFLDPTRFEDTKLDRRVWDSPRGLLHFDGPPGRFWMLTERALSEWDTRGSYVKTVFADSAYLEEPSAIGRVGDDIFVLSEDKKLMLVFSADGKLVRKFGAPHLDRAKDFVVGADGLLYVGSSLLHSRLPGLVSIWDPKRTEEDAKPIGYRVPPDLGEDGTFWIHSLAFDDNGDLLVTEFSRGRLERWDLDRNVKMGILLDSDQPGKFTELERGPDGLVYMAGSDGIYRFDSRSSAEDLKELKPFFAAQSIAGRYQKPFSPAWLLFVPRSALSASTPPR